LRMDIISVKDRNKPFAVTQLQQGSGQRNSLVVETENGKGRKKSGAQCCRAT